MSTIGGLLLPQFQPYDLGRTLTQATNIQGGQLINQTRLLELAELRRQQEAQQLARQYYQQNPDEMVGSGGSLLGSPAPAGGPPGGGPMTQQTTMPGQPPGAPQVVPGGQDLSRFATPGGPPTSVLGALGPQGPAHPLMDLMRQNPDAAFAVQQRQLQTQDLALKRDEQRLTMGTKVMEYVGRLAQGVTDQASLDAARQELARVHPQAAAQLPQVYSKEAMAPFIAKALDVKEAMTLQVQDLTAQAAVIRARKEGRSVDVDNQLRAMGVQPGQETPAQIRGALDAIQQGKVDVSAAQGRGAAEIERTEKPLEGAAAKSVSDLTLLRTMTDDIAALRHDDFTGPVVGRTGFVREQTGKMKAEETAFRRTVKDVQDILGRLRSGAAIPAPEMSRLEGLAPSVNDPPEVFKSKLQSFQRALEQNRDSITRVGTTGRQQLREETTPTTPRVGEKPTSQGSTGAGGQSTLKPVGQMSREELLAERDRIRKGGA